MTTASSERVALITGAAKRLGADIARQLHSDGYHVVLHYRGSGRQAQALQEALNALRTNSASLLQGDLASAEGPQALAQRFMALANRCDVLVNNASSFYPTDLDAATPADWDDLMGSNLRGPFFLIQGLAGLLRFSGGCVVNIIDIHAERPLPGYPIYSIAKAGLQMLTLSLARELAPAVRVNGVAPGAILSPEAKVNQRADLERNIPLARTGQPADIARAVAYLAAADYVTGQVLAVDGGRSIAI